MTTVKIWYANRRAADEAADALERADGSASGSAASPSAASGSAASPSSGSGASGSGTSASAPPADPGSAMDEDLPDEDGEDDQDSEMVDDMEDERAVGSGLFMLWTPTSPGAPGARTKFDELFSLDGALDLISETIWTLYVAATAKLPERTITAAELAAAKAKPVEKRKNSGREAPGPTKARRTRGTSVSSSASALPGSDDEDDVGPALDPTEAQARMQRVKRFFDIEQKPGPDDCISLTIVAKKLVGSQHQTKCNEVAAKAMIEAYLLLDGRVQDLYFKLVEEDDAPIAIGALAVGQHFTEEVGETIFTKLSHLSLQELTLMFGSARSKADVAQDDTPLFVMLAAGATLVVPSKVHLFLTEIGRRNKKFDREEPGPDTMSDASVPTSASAGPATPKRWTGRLVDEGQIALYDIDRNSDLVAKTVKQMGASAGGKLDFRLDPATEFQYRWSYRPPGGSALTVDLVAGACGLRRDWEVFGDELRRAGDIRQGVDVDIVPVALPGMRYWRLWSEAPTAGAAKRNLPRETFPLPPLLGYREGWNRYRPLNKAFLSELFGGANFPTKKRKGKWDAVHLYRQGIQLRRKPKRDTQAGGVMGKALKGLKIANADGSATDFVTPTLLEDDRAAAIWRRFSAMGGGVLPRDRTPAADPPVLRTAQEWCHLQGHGDGGSETLENFVAGSKHANSEQLAIETAQRRWFGGGNVVRARITSYLLPTNPVARARTTPAENKELTALGFTAPTSHTFPTFKADYEQVFKAYGEGGRPGGASGGHFTRVAGKWPAIAAVRAKLPASVVKNIPVEVARAGGTADAPPDMNRAESIMVARWFDQLHELIGPMFALPAPIAFAVRYKIDVAVGNHTPVHALDHFIQMQRESFDIIESDLLFWHVQHQIAQVIDLQKAVPVQPGAGAEADGEGDGDEPMPPAPPHATDPTTGPGASSSSSPGSASDTAMDTSEPGPALTEVAMLVQRMQAVARTRRERPPRPEPSPDGSGATGSSTSSPPATAPIADPPSDGVQPMDIEPSVARPTGQASTPGQP